MAKGRQSVRRFLAASAAMSTHSEFVMLSNLHLRALTHNSGGVPLMLKQLIGYASTSLFIFAGSLSCLAQTAGADTYKAKCQMCHAVDGSGSTPAGKAMKAHPFDSPDVLKESDADLIAIIAKGK